MKTLIKVITLNGMMLGTVLKQGRKFRGNGVSRHSPKLFDTEDEAIRYVRDTGVPVAPGVGWIMSTLPRVKSGIEVVMQPA